MKKITKTMSFIMAAIFSLSLILLIGGARYAFAEISNPNENIPVRVSLVFKDEFDGSKIKNVQIIGRYGYRTCDSKGNVISTVRGICQFGDTTMGQDPLKSNSKGKITFDISSFGGLSLNSKGAYSEIPVSFSVTAPSPYVSAKETYSFNVSYKNCKKVTDENGKLIAYEYSKTIKLGTEDTSYPGRVKYTFKDQNGNPVPYVKISGNYGFHTCDKDGNGILYANGITLIEDMLGNAIQSNTSGVAFVDVSAMGNVSRSSSGTYSVIDFHPVITYPQKHSFVSCSKDYNQIYYKNCSIVEDGGKKYYQCNVTIVLDGPKYETYTYPTKINLVFKDSNGNPVKGVHISGSAYGVKVYQPYNNISEMSAGGFIMPPEKDKVWKSNLVSNSKGEVTLIVKSGTNIPDNVSYDSWGGHTDLAIIVSYVAPDKYEVEYPIANTGSQSYETAAIAMRGYYSYKDFKDVVNEKTGEHSFEKTITITLSGTNAQNPTAEPTNTPKPTAKPTQKPTEKPTTKPTTVTTEKPTNKPTSNPTQAPTSKPTAIVTENPTTQPQTPEPTTAPTQIPATTPDETQTPNEQPTKRVDFLFICDGVSIGNQEVEIKNDKDETVYTGVASEINLNPGTYTIKVLSESEKYNPVYREMTFIVKDSNNNSVQFVEIKYNNVQTEIMEDPTPDPTESPIQEEPSIVTNNENTEKSDIPWALIGIIGGAALIAIVLAAVIFLKK